MGSPVTQWQVITSDPGKHSEFYATVFGWKVNAGNPLGYRMVDSVSAKGMPGGSGLLLRRLPHLYSFLLKWRIYRKLFGA
ncbi:MAG TPA: hypothetical protein VLK33_17130 [Terriglobales bacterium]|nr:hypothetical protein [Terriglobales bacterium]